MLIVSAGEIPASVGQLTNLTELSLGGNQLCGKELPNLAAKLCCAILLPDCFLLWFADPTVISRDADAAAGEIPASMGQLTNLTTLYLEGNQLSGKKCLMLCASFILLIRLSLTNLKEALCRIACRAVYHIRSQNISV